MTKTVGGVDLRTAYMLSLADWYGDSMLQRFEWQHLPPDLQPVAKRFAVVACDIVSTIKPIRERKMALEKLLEARDAVVHAGDEND